MSVCAVMLVKDEADIIGDAIRRLMGQVDELIVSDNLSTDGTLEILTDLQNEFPFTLHIDTEVGYYQARKTTALAQQARERGHQWVLPCDADEYWYAPSGRRIADYLAGVAPDVQIVKGALYNHIPTALDNADDPYTFRRIGWRLREPAPLGKVCCRTDPDLRIEMGNHSAWMPGAMLSVPGLIVRHYTWRSDAQYVRKIVNGAAAYAATDMPESVGAHWRMFDNPPNLEAVRAHFRHWFWSEDPYANDELIYDPAPFT